MTPYFTALIADEVAGNLKSLDWLQMMLGAARALVSNEHIHLEHYLHQLMPPVLSCLVSKGLGSGPSQDHWAVRDNAARVLALICSKYSDVQYNIKPRICR